MENIRYIKRIDTNNKTAVYLDGETIEFTLPQNKIDLSTFKIYYDVEIDPVCLYTDYTYLKRFMPRLASSCIDTLIIFQDDVEIQTIKYYNVLQNIINDALKETDEIDGNRPDTLNYSYLDDDNNAKIVCDFINNDDPAVLLPLKYSFFIKSFLGFINENNSPVLDCTKHKYRIVINLAPREITYRGLENSIFTTVVDENFPADYHYRLSNVYANVDVLPNDTPSVSKLVFKHYHTIKGSEQIDKNFTISYKHKGQLNYIIGSCVVLKGDTGLQLAKCNEDTTKFGATFKETYDDIEELCTEGQFISNKAVSSKVIKAITNINNLDNSLYFRRDGSNLKYSQYYLNGQALTPSMDMVQIYNTAKDFFNGAMDRVKSLTSFENEFFVFPVLINQNKEDYLCEIEWVNSSGDRNNTTTYPFLFLCYNKSISV